MATAAAVRESYMTTRGERTSYGLYFTGQNIFYMLVTNYLVTYLMFLGIDLTKTATVMLIVKVWDAVNDALFGAIFDKVRFKSGLKCLPWLRISAAFIPLATILIFIIPQGAAETVKLAWFAIAYLLWDTAYTFCDVPIFTMVTTMTDRLDERNSLMARGRIFSGGGMAIAGVLCTVLVSEQVGLGFGATAALLSALGCLLMIPICVKGKERNYNAASQDENFTLREMLRYLVHNKYLLIYYGGSVISGSLATAGTLGMFTSYYFFGSAVFNLLLTALSAVPAVILAFFTPAILRRVDKFKFFVACNVFSAVFGLVIYFVGYGNVPLFVALSVIRAIPVGAIGVVGFMFTPDCAEYGRFKTGTDAKGITFAIQTFSTKINAAVSSSLGLFLLKLFDWVSVEANSFADLEAAGVTQSATALRGLWIVYALVPVVGSLLALVFYAFYRLNDKDVQIMAKCNAGEITRAEAEAALSRNY